MCFIVFQNIILRNLYKFGYSNHRVSLTFINFLTQAVTHSHGQKVCTWNFCLAIFDLMNTTPLKDIIIHRYTIYLNSTNFTSKVSLLEVCCRKLSAAITHRCAVLKQSTRSAQAIMDIFIQYVLQRVYVKLNKNLYVMELLRVQSLIQVWFSTVHRYYVKYIM